MEHSDIQKAIKIFKSGGIVIFPTDTAFGIGCRMDDENAVEKIFELRNRPQEKALLILASDQSMAEKYIQDIPDSVKKLMDRYWPGGLTIIYFANTDLVPSVVRGGKSTIGIRVPDHADLREIIQSVGMPIVAPSANRSGEPTPYSLSDVDKSLMSSVDFVLAGNCPLQKQSTIIDCSVNPWQIIREGAVKIEL